MAKFYHFTTPAGLKGLLNGDRDSMYDVYPDYDLNKATNLDEPQRAAINSKLQNGGCMVDGKNIRGLWPSQRFVAHGEGGEIRDPLLHRPIIEGVMEPFPENWNTNSVVPNELDRLLGWIYGVKSTGGGKSKLILLEIETNDKDKAFVTDWVIARSHTQEPGSKGRTSDQYWEKRVPIDQYTGKEGFHCPIAVCWNPIPPDRIKVMLEVDIDGDMSKEEKREKLRESVELLKQGGHVTKMVENRSTLSFSQQVIS